MKLCLERNGIAYLNQIIDNFDIGLLNTTFHVIFRDRFAPMGKIYENI